MKVKSECESFKMKVYTKSESFEMNAKSESESFQAATVCFNEALDLLSKSNEGEKIKKDFTAILHVSTNTFYKSKDCEN